MNSTAPAVCWRCGRPNREGRQFCVGCAEGFIPLHQMTDIELVQYLTALRNWYLLYLHPARPVSTEKETCWLCEERRDLDALFCGNCGTVFNSLVDLELSPVVCRMMETARLARFQYLAQQGETPFDYGVRDFTSREEIVVGVRKKRDLTIEEIERWREAALDWFQQREEAKARAEEAVGQRFLDELEPIIALFDHPSEEAKQRLQQTVEKVIRQKVAPAYVKTAIAAHEHGKRILQKTMYYGLPLELPDVPWSNWSLLSKRKQAEILKQHKLIQKWWECAMWLAMVGFGLASPFVVSFGLLMGFGQLKALLVAVAFGLVLMGLLNALFLSFLSPQLASPLNRSLRFLGPVSLVAGTLLSWFMGLSMLPVILVMTAWFFASPYVWVGMRIPVWKVRRAIISRLERLPPKPE